MLYPYAVTVGSVNACRVPVAAIEQLCLEHRVSVELDEKLQSALRETEQWLDRPGHRPGLCARVRMARLLLRLRDGESSRVHNFSQNWD